MNSIFWTLSDVGVMIKRNLLRYVRLPQLLVFSTIQPVMFLLLFAFVFGGAIKVSNSDYINFLIPGILVQTVLFGSMMTGVGLAEDMTSGIVNRFRSLPMARSAFLAGRTITDMIRNVFVVYLMVVVGTFIGFRVQNGWDHAFASFGLIILFGFAFSWISAAIGLAVKDVETAQSVGFIWVFPLAFASSIFVPVETMPAALRSFAELNPITLTVDAVRALLLGGPYIRSLWLSLAWIAGILAVFPALAVYLYRKKQ